jgi:hypothetical protein
LPGGCSCLEGTAADRAASEQFGAGYYYGTGSDTSAVAFVAMVTSNYGGWFADSSNAGGPTLTWSHSYDSSGSYYYYDFDDAAGCPQCQNSWSERNVYYMAYGDSLAEPLPEIYNNAMATECERGPERLERRGRASRPAAFWRLCAARGAIGGAVALLAGLGVFALVLATRGFSSNGATRNAGISALGV